MKEWFLFLALCNAILIVQGQGAAKVSAGHKVYTTYPFSDPDPVASPQKLYPYFRFDGFTNLPEQKQWKTVILENDFIRVQIMPEIGGKIWSAYDKINKRDYIYNNAVVKFRDIAMRGPWTSGGIEANYGIIGHTPNTATPVDYQLQQNPDGSASCFIHAFDLLSRSNWTLEIRLEKDKGYFSTRSFWFSSNAVEQPYYTWMNLAVPASDDLHFLYPGNRYIGHDGDVHPWPIDREGRDLSAYKTNNFGGSKSYHVFGAHSNSFGVYYEGEDQGMMRYALREDKVGKKIFLWAQSGEGRIWKDLLTDNSGQYVEIQSGRLFNQNVTSSSLTPFKQIGFAPYQSDTWTESWMPFAGVGRPNEAKLSAVIQVSGNENKLHIALDPKRVLHDSVYLLDTEGAVLNRTFLTAAVGKPTGLDFVNKNHQKPGYLKIGDDYFDITDDPSRKILNRPDRIAKNTGADSNQVKLFEARDFMRFRLYREAEAKLDELRADSVQGIDLLIEQSKLAWFKMDYRSCYNYCKNALSIDTYNPAANYYYGLAALKLGNTYDALDGFEIASLDITWRDAAYTQLAKYYYGIKQYNKAYDYALKALVSNELNIDALQIKYLVSKKTNLEFTEKDRATVSKYDPFNALFQFEEHQSIQSEQEFRNEQLLELGIWYAALKEYEKAGAVLRQIEKPNTEMLLWLAWLSRQDIKESKDWLSKAAQSDPAFVFPFREESAVVFDWAARETNNWKIDYLKALLYRFRNQDAKALNLLKTVKAPDDFAAFYAVKSGLEKQYDLSAAIRSMQKAVSIDPKQWRYGLLLTQLLNAKGAYKEALNTISVSQEHYPANYIVGLTAVRTFLLNQEYKQAENALSKIHILPFENATEAHRYFVQVKLLLAYQQILDKQYKLAQNKIAESRTWPANLGVGEPYATEKNELLADWLMAYIMKQRGNSKEEMEYLHKVAGNRQSSNRFEKLLQDQALTALGGNTIKGSPVIENEEQLVQQIQQGNLAAYWPELINKIYFMQDRRLF